MEILLEEYCKDAIILDGFDEAIIGVVEVFGGGRRILYDKSKIMNILTKENPMTWSEAEEYYDFNIIGGYFGELNPVFLDTEVIPHLQEDGKVKFKI